MQRKTRYNIISDDELITELLIYILDNPLCKKMNLVTHFNISDKRIRYIVKIMNNKRLIFHLKNKYNQKQKVSFAIMRNGVKYVLKNYRMKL